MIAPQTSDPTPHLMRGGFKKRKKEKKIVSNGPTLTFGYTETRNQMALCDERADTH